MSALKKKTRGTGKQTIMTKREPMQSKSLLLVPYDRRLKAYTEEKNLFIRKNADKPAEFIEDGLKKLAKKWGI